MSFNELINTEKEKSLLDKLRDKFSKVPKTTALLLDTSGSMSGGPIERLREIANNFRGVRRFQFHSYCRELRFSEKVGEAMGNTSLHTAFDTIKSNGIKNCVLITDGEPDKEAEALRSSEGLKIDIIYVGPEPPPPFLKKLAEHTGGKYENVSLQNLEIETKVQLLLGSGDDAPKGPIQL